MSKAEYLDAHRHKIAGLVLEAQMHPRAGAELSMSLKPLFGKIDSILGEAWDAAHGVEPVPPQANGKPAAPARKLM